MSRALNIVLPAKRINSGTGLSDISSQQCEIDDRHHALGSLQMLGHPKSVHRHRRSFGRIDPRGLSDQFGIDAASLGDSLWRIFGDKFFVLLVFIDSTRNKILVHQSLVNYRVCQCVENQNVSSGPQLQMNVGNLGKFGQSRIDDYQLRSVLHHGLFYSRSWDRMIFARVRSAEDDRSGSLNVVERICHRSGADHHLHRRR